MRQLTFIGPRRFEWQDVPDPLIQADNQAIVRPLAVARCDLDLYIASGLVPYAGPFAFGHEMIAEVVEAGPSVPFQPGTRVAVPFQISCGSCDACRRGLTNSCQSVPFGAAFGLKQTSGRDFGGAFSDRIRVPFADHMLIALPDSIDPVAAASAPDNIADGWRAVAGPLRDRPGASVLVVGGLAQSVGLYAAASAVALGAGRVVYADDNADRRALAAAQGAETLPLALAEGGGPLAGAQFDIVVEAAGDAAALSFAIQATAANGVLTSVAIHLSPTTAVPLTRAYYKGLTFHTGRVQSRMVLPDVLNCIACGRLHPAGITRQVLPFAAAPEAMADPAAKLVFVPGF
jgi:threonine dehydrogenase-like Zn-dependent dehydrogenase